MSMEIKHLDQYTEVTINNTKGRIYRNPTGFSVKVDGLDRLANNEQEALSVIKDAANA